MPTTLLILTLILVLPGAAPEKSPASRPAIPGVPDFPDLTREQEDAFDKIVDDFIRVESGLLKGAEADKARDEFQRLPAEAIYALIRGLNRAAALESPSAPPAAAKKTVAILTSSTRRRPARVPHREHRAPRNRARSRRSLPPRMRRNLTKIVDGFIDHDLGNLRAP